MSFNLPLRTLFPLLITVLAFLVNGCGQNDARVAQLEKKIADLQTSQEKHSDSDESQSQTATKNDEVEFPKMHISTYSLAETFDVGSDFGTQVDPNYEGSPFPYKGDLDQVTITMTD